MNFSNTDSPRLINALVAFADIQGFAGIASHVQNPLQLFELLNGWACVVMAETEAGGGRIVKCMGDGILLMFPDDAVDAGVAALLAAKKKSEAFLAEHGYAHTIRISAHFGEIATGSFGRGDYEQFDIIGETVNTAAGLGRGEHKGKFIVSAQAFRKLTPSTRKLFHKYTPPIVYIAEP